MKILPGHIGHCNGVFAIDDTASAVHAGRGIARLGTHAAAVVAVSHHVTPFGKVHWHTTPECPWGELVGFPLKRRPKDAIILAGQENIEKPVCHTGVKGSKS